MAEKDTDILERYTEPLSHRIEKEYAIGEEFYHGEVKKGLRNSDGTGVLPVKVLFVSDDGMQEVAL